MSVMPTAREVLAHLNYLGYTNINARQLKDFMLDLKRFIKYEEQCARHQPEKHQELDEPDYTERDVFEDLHKTETVASKAKKKTKPHKHHPKEHVVTVHVKNHCQQPESVPKLVLSQDSDNIDSGKCTTCQCSQVQLSQAHVTSAVSVDKVNSAPSTSKSVPSVPSLQFTGTATGTGTSLASGTKRTLPKSSRSSFIRPKVINKPLKSDPVALYHQYKHEWDKMKFPGQHQHCETRWAVREKLLGDS